jgi:hypothetical protein
MEGKTEVSDDLKVKLERLVEYVILCLIFGEYQPDYSNFRGISHALKEANKEISTGISAYLLAEENEEAIKKANQELEQLLQNFQVCYMVCPIKLAEFFPLDWNSDCKWNCPS